MLLITQWGKLLLDLLLEGLPPARVEEGPPFCAYNTTDQWILRLRGVSHQGHHVMWQRVVRLVRRVKQW